jgi:hypothetical protein
MIDVRLRSRISDDELDVKLGKIVTAGDYNALLTGPATVRKPDGSLLCIYLPRVLEAEAEAAYPILTKIRATTKNRGAASASPRVTGSSQRSNAMAIQSTILGAFDPQGPKAYCRLTAYTAKETAGWHGMAPYFRAVARLFETHVPDRYAAQARKAASTHPDWLVDGTPFSTITVNNTYPTGVHTDSGDLDEGFSCLTAIRRGNLLGGELVFPRYRVAVQLATGDLLLMDAHEHHGNTALHCADCGALLRSAGHRCAAGRDAALFGGYRYYEPERISTVCYYRTRMAECGSLADEGARQTQLREERNRARLGLA